MNRYLIAALYVVTGCAVIIPTGVRGGTMPVRVEGYRLFISETEKIVTIAIEKKSLDDFSYGLSDSQKQIVAHDIARINRFYVFVISCGSKRVETTTHPIRAPGIMRSEDGDFRVVC